MKRNGGTKPMTPALAQPAYESHAIYSAPFRERLPNGELGDEYGPRSAQAQAAQTARIRDWSWKAPPRDQRRSKLSVEMTGAAVDVAALSMREAQVWRLVVVDGHAVRWVAKTLGMRRQTVASYLARIKGKAGL